MKELAKKKEKELTSKKRSETPGPMLSKKSHEATVGYVDKSSGFGINRGIPPTLRFRKHHRLKESPRHWRTGGTVSLSSDTKANRTNRIISARLDEVPDRRQRNGGREQKGRGYLKIQSHL